jgi:hypothetical protein
MIMHIAPNFSSTPTVFHHFFTCITRGDVDLCFSLMLRKASADEEETK